MTGCADITIFVLVVGRIVVGMVRCLSMAGLTYSIPWRAIIIKGKVSGALLEDSKVKSSVNMKRCCANKLQVKRFYAGMGICDNFRTMRVVTRSTVNNSVSVVNYVIAHIAHCRCLAGRIVTFFTSSLLLLTPGCLYLEHTAQL
jgi:hypothetical protein